jgi:hypothetical protein
MCLVKGPLLLKPGPGVRAASELEYAAEGPAAADGVVTYKRQWPHSHSVRTVYPSCMLLPPLVHRTCNLLRASILTFGWMICTSDGVCCGSLRKLPLQVTRAQPVLCRLSFDACCRPFLSVFPAKIVLQRTTEHSVQDPGIGRFRCPHGYVSPANTCRICCRTRKGGVAW